MRGQSQIIVGGQVDNFLVIKRADGSLLVVEHAQFEVRAFGLEFVELISEIKKRIHAGCSGHEKNLATDLHGFTRIESTAIPREGSGNGVFRGDRVNSGT